MGWNGRREREDGAEGVYKEGRMASIQDYIPKLYKLFMLNGRF